MPFVQATPITVDTKLVGAQLEAFKDYLDELMDDAAEEFKQKLATEPPQQYIPWNKVGGPPPAFVSLKQQYFVWKSVAEGNMDAPYQRTHALSEAWKITKQRLPNLISRLISNSTSYAGWIYDKTTQVYRAKTVQWPTVQDVAEKDGPKIMDKVIKAASKYKP